MPEEITKTTATNALYIFITTIAAQIWKNVWKALYQHWLPIDTLLVTERWKAQKLLNLYKCLDVEKYQHTHVTVAERRLNEPFIWFIEITYLSPVVRLWYDHHRACSTYYVYISYCVVSLRQHIYWVFFYRWLNSRSNRLGTKVISNLYIFLRECSSFPNWSSFCSTYWA